MTTAVTPTTELEAVNILLACIEESPVVSLDDAGLVDVAMAKATLSEVSRAVQKRGWHFNVEEDYPLNRDGDSYIPVPSNVAKLKPARDHAHKQIAHRGVKLYDLKNHTYTFTEDIKVDVTLLLPFEELPEAARHYIAVRAGRVFQGRVLGSETLHKFTEEDEAQALVDLAEAEGDTGDYNVIRDNSTGQSILLRDY